MKSNRNAAEPSRSAGLKWPATPLVLAGIFLLALAARGVHLYEMSGTLPFSVLVGDGREYDAWAQRIAAGDWLGSEIFYQAPLYPYFLAVIYGICGHHLMLVRCVQAILGASSCLLLAWAGFRFFQRSVGLVAGGLLAIYPPAIFFDGLIQKPTLDLWLITLTLALLGEFLSRRRTPWLIASGVALGFLTLNRENAMLLWPIITAWILFYFRDASFRRRAAWAALFTAAGALVLLPVGWRNYHVGGEFLLTTSQFGSNFYIGNHAGASGRYESLVAGRGDPMYERADARQLAEQALGRTPSPSEVSDYWFGRALAFIRSHPGDWLRLFAWKCFLVFNSIELIDTEGIDVWARFSSVLRVLGGVLSFGVLLPPAAFGIWATRRDWRRLAVLHAVLASLALSIALFFVFARYRFSLVPGMALFAAAGLIALPVSLRAWHRKEWLREWGPGFLLVAATAVLANWPLPNLLDEQVTYFSLGTALLDEGRAAEAVAPLRKAIEIKPDFATAYHNLGLALAAQDQEDAAAEQFALALRYNPRLFESQMLLARHLLRAKRPSEAIAHLRIAAELRPDSELPHADLAQALLENGESAGAVEEYRAALRLAPDSVEYADTLAWVLATDPDPRVRDGAEAAGLIERLLRAGAKEDAVLLDCLAAGYAAAGRFEEAVTTARRALQIAQAEGNALLAREVESRLRLYESGQSVRRQPKPASQ